jgi:hypothetical protein
LLTARALEATGRFLINQPGTKHNQDPRFVSRTNHTTQKEVDDANHRDPYR